MWKDVKDLIRKLLFLPPDDWTIVHAWCQEWSYPGQSPYQREFVMLEVSRHRKKFRLIVTGKRVKTSETYSAALLVLVDCNRKLLNNNYEVYQDTE